VGALAACALAVTTATASAEEGKVARLGELGSLILPAGLSVRDGNNPPIDFRLFAIVRSSAPAVVLQAYAGNAPDYPYTAPQAKFMAGTCSGIATSMDRDGKQNWDALIKLRPANGFPISVHFFARGLSQDDSELAKQIAGTLKLAPGMECASTN
jgi:hypothetical protein